MTYIFVPPPLEIYKSLRGQTTWNMPSDAAIKTALRSSLAGIYRMDGDVPIAMARLIGDGAISLHIVDVIVAKSKRRQGVGRDLMKTLIDAMKSKYAPEASVTLMAARDQSRFYEALGFTPRPSAHFGPGMIAPLGDL